MLSPRSRTVDDLVIRFTSKGPPNKDSFLATFNELSEYERFTFARSGAAELLLSCFDSDWLTVSLTLTLYGRVPATRFLATYRKEPQEFYPKQPTAEICALLEKSNVVKRDYERILGQRQSGVTPQSERATRLFLLPGILPRTFKPAENIRTNDHSDGATARRFLDSFGTASSPNWLLVAWTLDDLDPCDSILQRVTMIVADTLEFFGSDRQQAIEFFGDAFFGPNGLGETRLALLAQIGFIEAFLSVHSAANGFDWRMAAVHISKYTDEAPSAIVMRNSEDQTDLCADFDEELTADDCLDDSLVKLITKSKVIRDDFIAMKDHQNQADYDLVVSLPHKDVRRKHRRLCKEHQIQVRNILPTIKDALRRLYF